VRRGVTAEIDLAAAAHNLNELKRAVGRVPLIAVVKADAYGHGAVELSRTYEKSGVQSLAVAFVSEALELRDAGIRLPILVLFDRSDIPAFFEHSLTPVIHDTRTAEDFSREAEARDLPVDVHVKVDTGMGRMGFLRPEGIPEMASLAGLRVAGLMSHFSEADLADTDFMRLQLRRFHEMRELLSEGGIRPLCHIANSAATLAAPEARLDAVRPGLALYGVSPFEDDRPGLPELRPLMRATVKVLALRRLPKGQPVSYGRTFVTTRETLAAVLAVGYADGYPRLLSNASHVLIRGRRAPVIGRVCMDLMVADATDVEDPVDGEDAVLLGADGAERITAWELAGQASTIPYEILTSLGRTALRRYST
jgi:alanine racemase